MQLKVLEPIIIPEHLALCPFVQRRAEGLRFRLFGLMEFDRIIYIDADAIVVGPMVRLFSTPHGVFLSATVNSTRWLYPTDNVGKKSFSQAGAKASGVIRGVSMLNTGVMVISPWK